MAAILVPAETAEPIQPLPIASAASAASDERTLRAEVLAAVGGSAFSPLFSAPLADKAVVFWVSRFQDQVNERAARFSSIGDIRGDAVFVFPGSASASPEKLESLLTKMDRLPPRRRSQGAKDRDMPSPGAASPGLPSPEKGYPGAESAGGWKEQVVPRSHPSKGAVQGSGGVVAGPTMPGCGCCMAADVASKAMHRIHHLKESSSKRRELWEATDKEGLALIGASQPGRAAQESGRHYLGVDGASTNPVVEVHAGEVYEGEAEAACAAASPSVPARRRLRFQWSQGDLLENEGRACKLQETGHCSTARPGAQPPGHQSHCSSAGAAAQPTDLQGHWVGETHSKAGRQGQREGLETQAVMEGVASGRAGCSGAAAVHTTTPFLPGMQDTQATFACIAVSSERHAEESDVSNAEAFVGGQCSGSDVRPMSDPHIPPRPVTLRPSLESSASRGPGVLGTESWQRAGTSFLGQQAVAAGDGAQDKGGQQAPKDGVLCGGGACGDVLPWDSLALVFSLLGFRDLHSCVQVNRRWRHSILGDEELLAQVPIEHRTAVSRAVELHGRRGEGRAAMLQRMHPAMRIKICCRHIPALLVRCGEAGNAEAMAWYAECLEGQGSAGDRRKALEWRKKAARQGHQGCQYLVGMAFYRGDRELMRDGEEALAWLLRCVKNPGSQPHVEAAAALLLGYMYLDGEGTERADISEAIKWLTKARDLGCKEAEETVGWLWNTGQY